METEAIDLSGFYGTENYYHFKPFNFLMTDGVKYLADKANCYWLITAICSHWPTFKKDELASSFSTWDLKVNSDKTAVLTCQADSGLPFVVEQKIEYTDFPMKEIRLFVAPTEMDGKLFNVIMLTSEY